jgi:hypothetical protein
MATTTTGTVTLMLGATTHFTPVYLRLQGEDDFADYVFTRLKQGTLSATQAANLWQYTDGYKIVLETNFIGTPNLVDSTTATAVTGQVATITNVNAVHCLKKTKSGIDTYDNGAICFSSADGALTNVGYYGAISSEATSILVADTKWPIEATDFTKRAWNQSTNPYAGFLDYSPVAEDTEMTGSTVTWSLFQPKWQTNDYYENNFRLNKYDSATMYWKDGTGATSLTTLLTTDGFNDGGEQSIVTSAVSLGFSAAVAFAAAALTF